MASLLSTSPVCAKIPSRRNASDDSRLGFDVKGLKGTPFSHDVFPSFECSKRWRRSPRLGKILASSKSPEDCASSENANFGLLLPRHIAIAAAIFSMHASIVETALSETSPITESERLRQNLLQMIKARTEENRESSTKTAPPLKAEPSQTDASSDEPLKIPKASPNDPIDQPLNGITSDATVQVTTPTVNTEPVSDAILGNDTGPSSEIPSLSTQWDEISNQSNSSGESVSDSESATDALTSAIDSQTVEADLNLKSTIENEIPIEPSLTTSDEPNSIQKSPPSPENPKLEDAILNAEPAKSNVLNEETPNQAIDLVDSNISDPPSSNNKEEIIIENTDKNGVSSEEMDVKKDSVTTSPESISVPVTSTEGELPETEATEDDEKSDTVVNNLVNRFLNLIPAQANQDAKKNLNDDSIINNEDDLSVQEIDIDIKGNDGQGVSSSVNDSIISDDTPVEDIYGKTDSGNVNAKDLKPESNSFSNFLKLFPSLSDFVDTNVKKDEPYGKEKKFVNSLESPYGNDLSNDAKSDGGETVQQEDERADVSDFTQNEEISNPVGLSVERIDELANDQNLKLVGLSILPTAIFGGLWFSERQKNKSILDLESELKQKLSKINSENVKLNSDYQEEIENLKTTLSFKLKEQAESIQDLEEKKKEIKALNDEVSTFKSRLEVMVISQERLENELKEKEIEGSKILEDIDSLRLTVKDQQDLISDGQKEVDRLKNELSEGKNKLKAMEEESNALKNSVQDKNVLSEKLLYLENSVDSLNSVIAKKQEEIQEKEREIENIEKNLILSQQTVVEKENEINSLKNDIEFLISKSASKSKEIESISAVLEGSEIKNSQYAKAVIEKENELNSLNNYIERMRNDLNENVQKINVLSSNVNRLESELLRTVEERNKRDEQLSSAIKNIEELEISVRRGAEKEEAQENEIRNLTNIITMKEDELVQYLNRVDELETEVKDSSQLIVKLRGEISSLRQSLSEQTIMVAELRNSLSDTKTVLGEKEKRENELEAIVIKLHQKEKENEDLVLKIEDLKATIKNLRGNLQVEQQISATAGAQLTSSQKALEEEKKVMEVLKQGLKEASEGLDTLNSEIRNLNFQLESARDEMEKKEKQLLESKELLEAEREKVGKLELELNDSKKSIQELTEERQKLISNISDLENQIKNSNEELLLLRGKATELSRNMEIAKIKLESIAVVRAEAAWMVEQFEDEAAREKEEKEELKRKYEMLEAKTRATSTMAFELKSVKNELLQVQDSLNAAQEAREEVERAASALHSLASKSDSDIDDDSVDITYNGSDAESISKEEKPDDS